MTGDIPQRVAERAVAALSAGSLGEVRLRLIGQFSSREECARAMTTFVTGGKHTHMWPFTHIDWCAAAEELFAGGQIIDIDGWFFDAGHADVYAAV